MIFFLVFILSEATQNTHLSTFHQRCSGSALDNLRLRTGSDVWALSRDGGNIPGIRTTS